MSIKIISEPFNFPMTMDTDTIIDWDYSCR